MPEKRAEAFVVEDPATVVNGAFRVLTAGRWVAKVVLAPDGTPVEFVQDDNYTLIKPPVFEGYALVSLEFT